MMQKKAMECLMASSSSSPSTPAHYTHAFPPTFALATVKSGLVGGAILLPRRLLLNYYVFLKPYLLFITWGFFDIQQPPIISELDIERARFKAPMPVVGMPRDGIALLEPLLVAPSPSSTGWHQIYTAAGVCTVCACIRTHTHIYLLDILQGGEDITFALCSSCTQNSSAHYTQIEKCVDTRGMMCTYCEFFSTISQEGSLKRSHSPCLPR